ncbi:hypothetical protein GF343_00910 [Candidatus Woesearchaeota archaeon]|nr:hypothetical protein [Candidatus Woesearchaeota archaeon]
MEGLLWAAFAGFNNDNFNVNCNNNLDNNGRSRGIAQQTSGQFYYSNRKTAMKTYNNLYSELCSYGSRINCLNHNCFIQGIY